MRENHDIEFKRHFPSNRQVAKQLAALAADGGALVFGVSEDDSSYEITPIGCVGLRERVEQIGQSIPNPPVQIESFILEHSTPGIGVLWVEIPASGAMLHQVDGKYYERGDVQIRPMRDSQVKARMRLREIREQSFAAMIDESCNSFPRESSIGPRTCVVARPIGAPDSELADSTGSLDEWTEFVCGLKERAQIAQAVTGRYWGTIRQARKMGGALNEMDRALFRDIAFRQCGAFHYLSYCNDWIAKNPGGIFPASVIRASFESIRIVGAIQDQTGQRRTWDLAAMISGVSDRPIRAMTNGNPVHWAWKETVPRDCYLGRAIGVSAPLIEQRPLEVIQDLVGRFIRRLSIGTNTRNSSTF